MRLKKNDLANYLGVHPSNVRKHYQYYLDVLDLKRKYLTFVDVAKVDGLKPVVVARACGVTDRNTLAALELH